MIGTCVGGAFALLAAAQPEIRDRIAFVGAFAPYSSMWTLAREVASRTRPLPHGREPWAVDQLTRRVFVRTLTEHLDPLESTRLRTAYEDPAGRLDPATLSNEARLVQRLLEPLAYERTESALHDLPVELRARLERMSPDRVAAEIHAPCIVLAHDRDDPVIPIGQSRHLAALLGGRTGVRYTEFTMFKHMDPTKVSLGRIALARELLRFGHALQPIFRI
ncbi:MAG: hypothetical protein IT336_09975 [Thermomicrobiales bacterium]|nr:hypothetical protein [Thermomicrobiales bacterium]